ncbi:hypothetical protein [Paraburkholderia bannensis]|uniref:hypothetical protein n=1 Tax=Paraburkholderia bannensis TaxID=765414 RepID=UPI002AB761AD|nr:hypothetical protein [Paraburkholderia bannensis]
MHLPHHQQMLRDAAAAPGNAHEKAARIAAVEKQIALEGGAALHIETGDNETLSQRVFLHQPVRPIPMKGFINHVDWATAKAA